MPDSPRSMQLVLIRHGESEWNRLNLFTRLDGRRPLQSGPL